MVPGSSTCTAPGPSALRHTQSREFLCSGPTLEGPGCFYGGTEHLHREEGGREGGWGYLGDSVYACPQHRTRGPKPPAAGSRGLRKVGGRGRSCLTLSPSGPRGLQKCRQVLGAEWEGSWGPGGGTHHVDWESQLRRLLELQERK